MARLILASGGLVVAILAMVATMELVTSERQEAVASMAAPAEEPTAGARAQLEPRGSVCQGVLHRPDPSQPRTFPAIYTQRTEAAGITVLAPAGVSERALAVARETIEATFAANDLEAPLVEAGAYVVISAAGQDVLELPEFACLAKAPNVHIFDHVCGVADHADYPVVTVNELDLLDDRSGPCAGLNILYHEVGHLVQNWAMGPADYFEVRILYQEAISAGKYHRQYAGTNPHEYFAEATQAYFHHGEPDGSRDRAWLWEYDPKLFALLERLYGP